jgi:hypothetical protein
MGDPTRAAGINRGDALGALGTSRATISFDRAMRRRRQAYGEALKASEARLGELTAMLGGQAVAARISRRNDRAEPSSRS